MYLKCKFLLIIVTGVSYIYIIDSHILISAPQPYFNLSSLMNTHYQTLKFMLGVEGRQCVYGSSYL